MTCVCPTFPMFATKDKQVNAGKRLQYLGKKGKAAFHLLIAHAQMHRKAGFAFGPSTARYKIIN